MAAAPPFSRLQLAAALLEYDNDLEDPSKPIRNAKESALFIPFRSTKIRPEPAPRRSSDFLGVNLPSDAGGSIDGRKHARGASRASTNALAMHNPFRASVASANMTMEDTEEGGGGPGEMEIDLSSWGLDSLIAKDKLDAKGKGKAKSVTSEQPPLSSVSAHLPRQELGVARRPTLRSRAMSMGDFDQIVGEEDEEDDAARPKSYASPLGLVGVAPQKLRSSSFSGAQTLQPHQQSVPFPSRSPAPAEIIPLPADEDDLDARPALHQRTHSSASWDSKFMLRDEALATRGRSNSNATMNSMNSKLLLDDQNPFALRPPSVASRFDPKAAAHARTLSNATLGTRMMMDNDGASVHTAALSTGAQRYSTTLELLRPKVLVMPSPLQNIPVPRTVDPHAAAERNGFTVLTDGKPLPPGAKSARPRSTMLPSTPPVASNSFTPNPRMNLTNSQLMFRNALTGADGQRDVTYEDIDGNIPRATQDGQQVYPFDDGAVPVADLTEMGLEPLGPQGRPPGKLYGKSLIDDLESRKLALKNKQRTFRGDDRPSMMSRTSQKRASTLIDPATLTARPTSQHMDSFNSSQQKSSSGGGVQRGTSNKRKTLLDFEGEKLPEKKSPVAKSVFGVDTLWEREMLKLKEMEAQERAAAEEKERQEALNEAREDQKRKSALLGVSPVSASPDAPRVSVEPPLLPEISRTPKRPPPGAGDEDDDEESEPELEGTAAKRPVETAGWNAGSSSEDEGPRRTVGTGLRVVKKKQKPQPAYLPADDDSDEDVPLAATIGKVAQRSTHLGIGDDSDDESKPLSMLIRKASGQSSLLPNFAFQNSAAKSRAAADDDDDEDEQPLGLRASRMPNSIHGMPGIAAGGDQDEDELPLAFHPEQQKRQQVMQQQQFMMAQQQQQQQQQMMMQSMYMNPMMGSGYFNPMAPMPAMPIMPPVQVPSPPPIQDPAKIGRVDRWRHDVAVEGE